MTNEAQAVLTRASAMENNVDPFGKKWGTGHQKQTALYFIGLVKESQMTDSGFIVEEQDGNYPSEALAGRFTSPDKAQLEITKYLTSVWDMNDEQVKKQEAKDRAAKQRLADADTSTRTASRNSHSKTEDKETTDG